MLDKQEGKRPMTIRKIMLSLLVIGAATAAQAGGTKEQQDACRRDVRRFCYRLPKDAGDNVFLSCLQAHRAHLSRRCRKVLEDNGV
jgi:hypothetical protein